jgi:DNA-nicking Smr family endonuclease
MSAGGGRRGRGLSEEEAQLWEVVARAVKPLRKRAAKAEKPKPAESKANVVAKAKPVRTPAATLVPKPVAKPSPPKPPANALDRRTKQKLGRGREAIDARIDLHGMTQAEAYSALSYFLRRVQRDGARFVIVVTGKGARGGEGTERGVLRRQVPQWLGLPEFREVVVGFDVAGIGHGGEGALYVQIRRAR